MTTSTPNLPETAPNCWQCRHFAVSWDPKLPYQCKLMGFKSRIAPALEVLRADGKRCRGFLQKSPPSGLPPQASQSIRKSA
jgi:hypothetical protein